MMGVGRWEGRTKRRACPGKDQEGAPWPAPGAAAGQSSCLLHACIGIMAHPLHGWAAALGGRSGRHPQRVQGPCPGRLAGEAGRPWLCSHEHPPCRAHALSRSPGQGINKLEYTQSVRWMLGGRGPAAGVVLWRLQVQDVQRHAAGARGAARRIHHSRGRGRGAGRGGGGGGSLGREGPPPPHMSRRGGGSFPARCVGARQSVLVVVGGWGKGGRAVSLAYTIHTHVLCTWVSPERAVRVRSHDC